MRLSMSSLAGTARTDVAVGTASEACMFVTTRAAGPLSTTGSVACAGAEAALRASAGPAVVTATGGGGGLAGAAGVAGAGCGAGRGAAAAAVSLSRR